MSQTLSASTLLAIPLAPLAASALVMSTTNMAFDPFPATLPGKTLHRIGDCMAPRQAPYAFHDGRKLSLGL